MDNSSLLTEPDKIWAELVEHLEKWFYHPDIQALEVALSAAASHYSKGDPVWLFIIGPSSGDKTSIVINSLLSLHNVHMIGDISSKTFLSGYTGTAYPSLLHKIGVSGILAFKDFTTFISKRHEEQAEIASHLREIYDGSFNKATGKGTILKWQGKITIIAAATPAIERTWATKRDLGERFLQVRITRKDGLAQAEFSQRQRGMEEFISNEMKRLAKTFFSGSPVIVEPPPSLSPSQMNRVSALAEFASYCRGSVPRHPMTNAICDLPQIENSARMAKALASLISGHAALFRHSTIGEEDMAIGQRVALNTIPASRSVILDAIPLNGKLGADKLQSQSFLAESTINAIIGDLEALGMITIDQPHKVLANDLKLTPLAQSLWRKAFDPLGTLEAAQLAQLEAQPQMRQQGVVQLPSDYLAH